MTGDASQRREREAALALQRALSRIEARVRRGDRDVVRALSAVSETPTYARLVLTGADGGEHWFVADRSGMRVAEAAPAPGRDRFGYAVEVAAAAAEHVLQQLARGAIEDEAPLLALSALASERAQELFEERRFAFELCLTDVAGLGQVPMRVQLGRPALDVPPEFSLRVRAADLEQALEDGAPPQQLFLAGKVEIGGDVAKAMLLGMTLAELG